MVKGKLIVIEGACDGIGKSTQCKLLKEGLSKCGHEVVIHHFPTYDMEQGVLAAQYLKGEFGKPSELPPYFINCLYAVDRAVTWHKELKREYEQGKIIILDRYTPSSIIYQSALINNEQEKKEFANYITDFEYVKMKIKKPDHMIFLWAPFDTINKLRSARITNDGIKDDIHEKDLVFMENVYKNAMFMADYLKWDKIKCGTEEFMRPAEEIHEDIMKLIRLGRR